MILTILLAALPQAQTPAVPEVGPNGFPATTEHCLQIKIQQAEGKPAPKSLPALPKARMRNLGELPPGDLHLTVMRNVAGCHLPTIIRYGIGRGGR